MQIFYTVRSGDTLSNIAMRWHIPLRSLIEANNLSAPYTIYPGQQLSMPPGVNTYVVKTGDSVFSISQRYGIPMNIIIEANGIESPYIIVPGMKLTVPAGVPFYVVRHGDSLYKIAKRYNVTINGQPQPNLIIEANSGLTPAINPGMTISIPYPPPGGQGLLATVMSDGFDSFIELYEPVSGNTSEIDLGEDVGRGSEIFWSPDQSKLAYVGISGVISIIDINSSQITKIDQINQTDFPAFIDWSYDGIKIIYSTGSLIRIYDTSSHTFLSINKSGASYVQWFPDDIKLLYEAKDAAGISQLYTNNTDGSDERQITNNQDSPLHEIRLSPNGKFVLYTSPGASVSIIYTIDLSTGFIYQIPGGLEGKNYYPTWSPNSTSIAYSSTHYINGKYYSLIRVSGARGEGDTTLAISSCYSTQVTWSPDSKQIAYLSACREDYPPVEVWSINISKTVPINVLSGFLFYNLDWSTTR